MKLNHAINSARGTALRFSLQAMLAVGVVVIFVLLVYLT